MPHLILLGDSIFDNARYVPGEPAVIEQVRGLLPRAGGKATLLAVDGHVTEDVARQLLRLPADASHLFVSVGGNDALGESQVLSENVFTVGEAFGRFHDVLLRFREGYRAMLKAVAKTGLPTAVCTIYDRIPDLDPAARTALAAVNEALLHEAFLARLPVIDLRLACREPGDYSQVSSIEPSAAGGAKIARLIVEVAAAHDFSARRSVIYS